jgi:Ca2+-binding EF-hand superfamily protein
MCAPAGAPEEDLMDEAELRENFQHFDNDDNGKIDLAEFGRLLDAIGAEMSDADKRIGFDAIDTNGNKAIEFEEFAAWWNER